jgi:hypothetical protein
LDLETTFLLCVLAGGRGAAGQVQEQRHRQPAELGLAALALLLLVGLVLEEFGPCGT